MLLLTSTSDKLQVITGSAVTVDVHASWLDFAAGAVTPGRTNTKITTATTTDLVGAPAASTYRNVKTLHICNIHATTAVPITVQHTDGTNVIKLEEMTLLAGERLSYIEGQGFELTDASGITKTSGAAGVFTQRLAANQSNSTTTATEVVGLSMAAGLGTWVFEYFLRFQSATSTVGPKLSVNYDGTVSSFLYEVHSLTAAALDSSGVLDQDATAMQVVGGMAARVKGATGALIQTAGVDTINADILIVISGLAVVTVAGNFELWHGSETATSTSIMADSALRITKVG